MVLFIRNKKLEKNYIERAERASQNVCILLRRKNVFHTDQKLEKKLYMIEICEQAIFFLCVCLKHAILLNIVLVNHIVCRYNVSLCS